MIDIKKVMSELTLEEKAGLCSGQTFWLTKAIERLGVPSVMMTDGPHGLRKEVQKSGGTNAFMKWFFPLFSLWLCFSYNAAFALYWAVSNVIAVVQNWGINWYLDRKEKNADTAVEGKIK